MWIWSNGPSLGRRAMRSEQCDIAIDLQPRMLRVDSCLPCLNDALNVSSILFVLFFIPVPVSVHPCLTWGYEHCTAASSHEAEFIEFRERKDTVYLRLYSKQRRS